MKHTIELDDLELTALMTHLQGQSEIMVESRLNSSNPSEMPDREEVLSEKILDDLFYPEFDKLASENDVFDEIVKDAEEALANESEIKSLNFRS